jgi:hypothetical protein
MALSNSVNFSISRDNLITMSLQHVGALGDGIAPNATQLTECSLLLNLLIKAWQVDGMQLWMTSYGYVFPVSAVAKVSLGGEGGNAATDYVYTTTSNTSSSGGTTVTLTSVTGVSDTNVIGIELSSGTMQWTTVSGAPTGLVVTLGTTLTGDVSSAANVYVYSTANRLTRPYQISEAFRRFSTDNTDTKIDIISMFAYSNLSNKFEKGIPLQVAYDKSLGFGASGYPGNSTLYFWPIFNDGKYVLVLRYVKLYSDLDAGTDNPEFPQHWFLPLMLGLAWLLGPKHGLTINERKLLLDEATQFKTFALHADVEDVSVNFQPNRTS